MKNVAASVMKKVGEKAAMVPVEVKSWPLWFHQPKMPEALAKQMEEQDKK